VRYAFVAHAPAAFEEGIEDLPDRSRAENGHSCFGTLIALRIGKSKAKQLVVFEVETCSREKITGSVNEGIATSHTLQQALCDATRVSDMRCMQQV
jgi:hypothetical protein